jgi:hypothetical protein
MSNKIKVVGYAKKEFFGNGIEYRNFSPDLVGVQLAGNGSTTLFTMGNFSITTNMEPKNNKSFITSKFSNFISLTNLDLTLEQTQQLLVDNTSVVLNLDRTNIKNYALFGSLTEFVRISLEDIITKWPASLYLSPLATNSDGFTITGNTFTDYSYDPISDKATFTVDTNFINNSFQINYLANGTILDTFNATNDLRNLSINYLSYAISYGNIEFKVLNFTGSTYDINDYIYFEVKGNPFSGLTTESKVNYHILPNKEQQNKFFNALPDFESYLLNRRVAPIYTSTFKYPVSTDVGVLLYVTENITWPVTDGYNIDFDSTNYLNFVQKLIKISDNSDLNQSDLINRFLVTESISAFDTQPVHLSELDQDTSGQKVNKTLRIYGREFDDINKFINGIQFSNTVTYNKEDNTPDVYLKNLARVLGWELLSSVVENDLLANYVTTSETTFSGESVGLTAVQADIELWRRIILNTPWIWKSKGARKSVEFLLKFIGAPNGLVKFNEYIYKATAPIDIDLFTKVLELNSFDTDLSLYPIDSDGFPRPMPDTPDMYFQNYGLWYRQTGGDKPSIDILGGNNPHLGPYDGGYKYINQFATLIQDFTAVTLTSQTITTGSENLFTNNQLGTYDGTTVPSTITTAELTSLDGEDLSDCYVFTPTVLSDVINPGIVFNGCGCPCDGSDNILSLCVDKNLVGSVDNPCNQNMVTTPTSSMTTGLYTFQYYQYNQDGSVYTNNGNPVPNTSVYTRKECCTSLGGTPTLYSTSTNSGYACCNNSGKCGCTVACKWISKQSPIYLPQITSTYNGGQSPYLEFTDVGGSPIVVTPDGCNCIKGYSRPIPNITDPYTGEVGYACQLTKKGVTDLVKGVNSVQYLTYSGRESGKIRCDSTIPQIIGKI